jgi:glucosylglycerate synthase
MYETALPEETQQRITEMSPAGLVVGIPSYRNSRTVGVVAERVIAALEQYYANLHPVIVHADGHSFDDTLSVAAHLPLPPAVRRVTTRYQGLPGKGSALRAIFEIAARLRAKAVLLVEADVVSIQEQWVPTLLGPILENRAEMVLPLYQLIRPLMLSTDLIGYPLTSVMFNVAVRHPAAGEVAMAGGVATYFAERDVWETDVARDGVDLWMPVEIALEEGRLAQVHLGPKIHRSHESVTIAEAKFLQEIGTLFRMGHLHERDWLSQGNRTREIPVLGQPTTFAVQSREGLPDGLTLWRNGKRAVKGRLPKQWKAILAAENFALLEAVMDAPDDQPQFNERLWARVVYDFLVVYNLGEGDPDKVVTALYPLFLMRSGAMIAAIEETEAAETEFEQLVQQQLTVFHQERAYLTQRWTGYISPEQIEMWRDLGIPPN